MVRVGCDVGGDVTPGVTTTACSEAVIVFAGGERSCSRWKRRPVRPRSLAQSSEWWHGVVPHAAEAPVVRPSGAGIAKAEREHGGFDRRLKPPATVVRPPGGGGGGALIAGCHDDGLLGGRGRACGWERIGTRSERIHARACTSRRDRATGHVTQWSSHLPPFRSTGRRPRRTPQRRPENPDHRRSHHD